MKTKGKWIKTTDDSNFIQWTYMWKEDGDE